MSNPRPILRDSRQTERERVVVAKRRGGSHASGAQHARPAPATKENAPKENVPKENAAKDGAPLRPRVRGRGSRLGPIRLDAESLREVFLHHDDPPPTPRTSSSLAAEIRSEVQRASDEHCGSPTRPPSARPRRRRSAGAPSSAPSPSTLSPPASRTLPHPLAAPPLPPRRRASLVSTLSTHSLHIQSPPPAFSAPRPDVISPDLRRAASTDTAARARPVVGAHGRIGVRRQRRRGSVMLLAADAQRKMQESEDVRRTSCFDAPEFCGRERARSRFRLTHFDAPARPAGEAKRGPVAELLRVMAAADAAHFFYMYPHLRVTAAALVRMLGEMVHFDGQAAAAMRLLRHWHAAREGMDGQLTRVRALARGVLSRAAPGDVEARATLLVLERPHARRLSAALPAVPAPAVALCAGPQAMEGGVVGEELLGCWSAADVANEMCVCDFELFRRVDVHEFCNLSFAREDRRALAPALTRTVERWNCVAQWSASLVVLSAAGRRGKAIRRLLALAEALLQRYNFHAFMAVMSGLNLHAVTRLRAAWDSAGEKARGLFERLNTHIAGQQNYRAMRDLYARARRMHAQQQTDIAQRDVAAPAAHMPIPHPPIVPYLGLYMRDFTYVHDGNPTLTEDGKVNLEKVRLWGKLATEIVQLQTQPCALPSNPQIAGALLNLRGVSEEDLYQASMSEDKKKK